MTSDFDNSQSQTSTVQSKEGLPVIWVLHNMPRSGGTLVSKCLGSMQSHVLLSEIHPDAQHALSFNALKQAQQWHGLGQSYDWQEVGFVSAIKKLEQEVSDINKQLVLRDWSHVDYLGPPVTTCPKHEPALINALADDFEIRSIQLVRHPLDTWLSLRRLNLIKESNIGLEQFLKAYRTYLESTKSMHRLVYENFLSAPDQQLMLACNAVGLTFDESYKEKWFNFDKITGDTSNSSSLRKTPSISLRPRKSSDGVDLSWLESQDDYCFIVKTLYPVRESL